MINIYCIKNLNKNNRKIKILGKKYLVGITKEYLEIWESVHSPETEKKRK